MTTVVACTFLESPASAERATLISSDSRGRVVLHNITGHLSSITNFLAGMNLSTSIYLSAFNGVSLSYQREGAIRNRLL